MNVTTARQQASAEETSHVFLGLAVLMRRAFSGEDLKSLAAALIEHADRHPEDANALMDLATILLLTGNREIALATQREALQMQPLYYLAPRSAPSLTVLVLMASGDLMANTPVEFLLEDSTVALHMLYVGADIPAIEALPEHDVMFVAIGESDDNRALLADLGPVIDDWPRSVVNHPAAIARLSRDGVSTLLQDAEGIHMPVCVRVPRERIEALAGDKPAADKLDVTCPYPIIVRPVGSHAGQGLKKIESSEEIADYLNGVPSDEFYVASFIDYRNADGLFRKFRIMLIDGAPYIAHMGISSHWMIHYLNAGMADNSDKRAEEAAFMACFDQEFAERHREAFSALARAVDLRYVGIDCAEGPDGRLLIFEVDSDMIVHAMDPTDLFPYKAEPMARLFNAYRDMLGRAAAVLHT